jgi:hypothetical protein
MPKRSRIFYKKVKHEFPEILKKAKGFVMMACQMAGIERLTYYRWLEEDADFAKRCDKAMEYSCAFIESKWLQNINKGSQGAIDKWLKYKGKPFGYTEDQVIVQNIMERQSMSEEDLKILEIYQDRQKQTKVD